MERCEQCPLKQFPELNDVDCYAKRHPKFCERAVSNVGYHPLIVQKSVALHNKEKETSLEAPSMFARAVNAGKAVVRAGVNAARGNKTLAPLEVVEARRAKCYSCPSNLYDKEKDICTHVRCGCRVTKGIAPGIPSKPEVASAFCDEGHWDAYIASNASPKKGCGCSGG